MDKQASSELEYFGTDMTNKSMVIMNLSQVTNKVFISWKIAITFSTFVLIHNSFGPSLKYGLIPFGKVVEGLGTMIEKKT